ncbi:MULTISPECIES: MFS transporter [Exiguobacterium]|uniref:MFS transporter n=1 Tax=Exiguobacterium TaxID=33986 RepID=UPI00087759AC|nr:MULTISPECIES: MFS transporter [Exiguobacterium]TCI25885.1 MFS transporter [Exiguobacterium sp. SH5S4]TCI32976.1 MFS transporter [Exiguobacterium sp. SH4S7]TCI42784.1 MFS transporter [Exiguobacterium sp. SH5S32]TCI50092.1 MFS transporter [Exiguobacterium sp. SH5S13]TCI50204.1 MFS transporter [Exiguobacterium sp. SH1S4]
MRNKIDSYVTDTEQQRRLYKRTLFVVVLSQIFGGAGLAAGITVGALLARDLLGTDAYAGVPTALFTLGSAGAAFLIGMISQRVGRRFGLATGFLTGSLGAFGVIFAAAFESVPLLFVSLLIYGAGTASNLQARYAGTDLANATERATAVSIAMVSTTFGAVAGPNLVEPMGRVADAIGIPTLSGPFLLAGAAYFVAGLILIVFLNPDPLLVARAIESKRKQSTDATQRQPEEVHSRLGVYVGAFVMVLSQIVMVAIMTMTPVHMRQHGHELSAVGLVIGFHIGAMYLPSLVTGVLVDKVGREIMAIASGVTLFFAGVVAAFAPADSLFLLIVGLVLLGVGWNFGLISGTAILVDATTPETRAKTQGSVDVWIALSGASGGMLSGIIASQSSYLTLSLLGGIVSLVLVPIVLWYRRHLI